MAITFSLVHGFLENILPCAELERIVITIRMLAFSGVVSPVPGQPQFMIHGHSPQFIQGGSSDQATG